MAVKLTQYSFARGEIAPDLAARTDVSIYSIALALLKNGYVRVGGGISNRAGTEFVCEAKDSSNVGRLIPFVFNNEQTYVIEAGNEYFRYVQNGGRVVNGSAIVETATTYLSSQLFDIKYAQTGDTLTLCHRSQMFKELCRTSNVLWTFDDAQIEPSISAPTNVSAVHSGSTSSSTKSYYYKVTAIKNGTFEESLPSAATSAVTGSVEGGWVLGEKNTVSWNAVDDASEYNVYKEVNGVYAYIGVTANTSFVDENVSPDLTTCIPIFNNPFDASIMPDLTSNSLPAGYGASISYADGSHSAFHAFDGNDSTYAGSTILPATLLGSMPEAKVCKKCVIKPGSVAPSAYQLIGRKPNDDTVDWENPKMAGYSNDECTLTIAGTCQQGLPWDLLSASGYCHFYRGVSITAVFSTYELYLTSLSPMRNYGASYICGSSCTVTLKKNGSTTYSGTYNFVPGLTLPDMIEFDTIIFSNFVGGGHPDLVGFGTVDLIGYTGGYEEVIFCTTPQTLTANTEATIEYENETAFTSYGIRITSNTGGGNTSTITKLDFQDDKNFPGCVGYFQQRRLLANTINKPNFIEASQTALFNSFNTQRPLLASNAVTSKLYDGKLNEIKNMVSSDDLVVFTADSEWKINGSDGVFEATPPPIQKKQSSWGSCDLMPLYIGDTILFVSAGKNKIRDLEYQYAFDKYKGNDLTYLASHLFDSKQIVDWSYSKEPNPTVWCVMSDGTINALTYYREQEVLGWHHHDTDGLFESVVAVREGYEDVPYFFVNRTINSATKRYVERMKSREISNVEDGFFVDCGLTQTFDTAVTTISGLDHLEGKAVSVLADGVEVKGLTVTDGAITLTTAAKKVTVGLLYDFEMQTLNVEGENTQGARKMINAVCIKVDKSATDFEVKGNAGGYQSTHNTVDGSETDGLFSGDLRFTVGAEPSASVYINIKQSSPYPITILSITPEVEVLDVVPQTKK